MEVKSKAVKNNIAWEPGMLGQTGIGSGQTGDGKTEHRHFGISELKWTGMGKFNSDNHYIYYCWQESLRKNKVALRVNRRVLNAVFGCRFKNDTMICLFPRQTS